MSVARVVSGLIMCRLAAGSIEGQSSGADAACHDAVEGELCYSDTIWAKTYAIHTRPEWYPGLTNESSFADFQAHLHYCYWSRCPRPCALTSQHHCTMTQRFWNGSACHDAKAGEKCHIQVEWAMQYGIHIYPEWYPTMTDDSTFAEFQVRLWRGQQSGLEQNDCPEPCCHDSVEGELCWEDATWAMLYGINIEEVNHVYPPVLTNTSAFEEFQAYLHLCYPQRCPLPCKHTAVQAGYHGGVLDCPDVRPGQ